MMSRGSIGASSFATAAGSPVSRQPAENFSGKSSRATIRMLLPERDLAICCLISNDFHDFAPNAACLMMLHKVAGTLRVPSAKAI